MDYPEARKVSQYYRQIKSKNLSKNDLCREMAKLLVQNEKMAIYAAKNEPKEINV